MSNLELEAIKASAKIEVVDQLYLSLIKSRSFLLECGVPCEDNNIHLLNNLMFSLRRLKKSLHDQIKS